jgi:acyl carrier protein
MREMEIRRSLAEVFRDSNVIFLREANVENEFIEGRYDVNFNQLDIDSLAAMEICIAMEANWGTAILPDDLYRIGSLQALVAVVMSSR